MRKKDDQSECTSSSSSSSTSTKQKSKLNSDQRANEIEKYESINTESHGTESKFGFFGNKISKLLRRKNSKDDTISEDQKLPRLQSAPHTHHASMRVTALNL